ncbi:hypothetical protein GSY69_00030 [Brevibacterium sp. 5221]|uniref:DUF4233 domain-containing protein n=1 Tax=Brevibacterium rongguiense TaxID=2695267 RepID=A0A6N9H313_9MICO|nr:MULTISPECIES: hypothetical protein [Brevibacterium]MYM18407.1 hypothetical protein [Brevibacterium rongguiense]WAL41448.1 hypothetical protein BRM1_06305 [Brevibacterium sp. BRM-1]
MTQESSRESPQESSKAGGPGDRARGPWTLLLAVAMTALEALALTVAAVAYVVVAVGQRADPVPLIALAAMFLLLAVGLVGVAIGLARFGRWARPACVAWQVLLLLFAFNVGPAAGLMFWAALIPAVLSLVGIFLPPSLRAYDGALADQEARLRAARQEDAA